MTKPIVLSLGELLWDMLPSGKRAGGAPVNFAYHAKMNGADGWSISAVGEDALGDELLAEAEKAGIHSIIQRNAWPTSTVEVSLKNGIPEYTIVKGVAWDHLLLTRQLIEVVEQADAICYGTLALRSPETHDTIIELLKHTTTPRSSSRSCLKRRPSSRSTTPNCCSCATCSTSAAPPMTTPAAGS